MAHPSERSITFIPMDWRSKPAQEAIRVHIMRQRHRQARLRRKPQGADAPQATFEEQVHFWQPRQKPDRRSSRKDPPPPHSASSSSHSRTPTSDKAADQSPGIGWRDDASLPSSAEERTALSDTATDQASSLTGQPNVEEMLIAYYHQFGGGSTVTHQFLRAYRETTGTFSAFLAMTSLNYSEEHGQSPPLDIAELENRALQEVNAQISRSPTAPASSTMVTVAVLANLRECRHEHDLVNCHWTALQQMVDINGGITRLRMHHDLYTFILWLEGVVLSTTAVSVAQRGGPCSPAPVADRQRELQDFLRTTGQRLRSRADPTSRLTTAIETVLYRTSPKQDPYTVGKSHRAKLANLLFFEALDQESTSSLRDDPCYQAIEAEVLRREQSYIVYPQELYLIMARVTNQDSLCELMWKVTRLLCVMKKLGQRDRNTCYRLFATSLGFSDPFELTLLFDECDELAGRVEVTDDHPLVTGDPC